MSTLLELGHMDGDLVPEILPSDVRLSISGSVEEFLTAITGAVDVIPAKEVIPNTSNVEIRADDSFGDFVAVSATDGFRTFERRSSELSVIASGRALLPGKRLRDILKLAPEETFRLDVLSTSASIRSGRAVWHMPVPPGQGLPGGPDVEGIAMREYPSAEFCSALSHTLTATARFTARMSLTQLSLSKTSLTGCDGSRVHRVHIHAKHPVETTLPAGFSESLLSELRLTTSEKFLLGASENTVVAQVGGSILTGQKLLLPYPNVDSLLLEPSMVNTDTLTVRVKEISDAIKRIRVSADPDLLAVSLVVRRIRGDWSLLVQAMDKAGNASQEVVPSNYSGDSPREESLNFRYLLDFLSCVQDKEVSFKLGQSSKNKPSSLYVKSKQFEGVIQPMVGTFA